MKSHAIIVQASYDDWIDQAHHIASDMFAWVSPISPVQMNGVQSFYIPPDGSKEGWPDSDLGDAKRSAFIEWLTAQAYEDGATPLRWVEVAFDIDDQEAHVTGCDKRSAEKM